MKTKQLNEWKASPRVAIRPGVLVRFAGGGPRYGPRSDRHRMTLPGTFRVVEILRRGKRVYLEVFGQNKTGGAFTVMVEGRPYNRLGITWAPYRVRRAKQ